MVSGREVQGGGFGQETVTTTARVSRKLAFGAPPQLKYSQINTPSPHRQFQATFSVTSSPSRRLNPVLPPSSLPSVLFPSCRRSASGTRKDRRPTKQKVPRPRLPRLKKGRPRLKPLLPLPLSQQKLRPNLPVAEGQISAARPRIPMMETSLTTSTLTTSGTGISLPKGPLSNRSVRLSGCFAAWC